MRTRIADALVIFFVFSVIFIHAFYQVYYIKDNSVSDQENTYTKKIDSLNNVIKSDYQKYSFKSDSLKNISDSLANVIRFNSEKISRLSKEYNKIKGVATHQNLKVYE